MIFFDTTKTGKQGHRSGLTRVSERLRTALGEEAQAVTWDELRPGGKIQVSPQDWFFSSELFSEPERPGFWNFLKNPPCHLGALFHDAIPLRYPGITWPQSVARHPEYMKMLASFERVWAVSRASGQELEAFWRWQGLSHTPQVAFLPLGADFDAAPRAALHSRPQGKPVLLCCGILEPRKNQTVLLDSCPDLWRSGLEFELHLVGRVNPNFGDAILKKLRSLSSEFPDLKFHEAASDAELSGLYARASATLFPTIAEGCGLPLLESLWRGLPCLCSDLPVLRENADAGGCLTVAATDPTAWAESIRRLLTEPRLWERLAQEAGSRPLPTWKESGQILRQGLTEVSESQ